MAVRSGAERTWARIGAGLQLARLDEERAAILKAFPALRRGKAVTAAAVSGEELRADGRPKRKFSSAAKKRMSAGMRKYWARRKAAAKAKAE